MNNKSYPIPPSHKTFEFGSITIDSNFDSGNCFNAEKVNNTNFNIWLATDHPKNNYRTWFYFSLNGVAKNTLMVFNIKNMQNQSKMLYEGLVPVYREESCQQWKRVVHKVDTAAISFSEGSIQWTFKHTMTSDEKVFLAFFYPWSNTANQQFLEQIQQKCKGIEGIYFKRSTVIYSFQGRPVQFLTISSKKGIINHHEAFDDEFIFPNGGQPHQFHSDKKAMVIGARIHPGQVPSSHVMTGIIKELTEANEKARILRDRFVFYLFPIFNPDGVARGHYRVDPNGVNLNRCYINPNPNAHGPIYAVKTVILHFHHKGTYFAFLDLHAHAARKGIFIYGNASDELQKQIGICLFPKILSMNSQNFEYEGSNFTEQNMYCKDRNDHVSKEGAGRVALFKATKNPYSWTLECNYNCSRIANVIENPRSEQDKLVLPNQKEFETDVIINYKYPQSRQPKEKEFYTIETFRKLGKEICESLLDLIEMNPCSRIDNPRSYFKSVQNLKLYLGVALLRMTPSRFERHFKKIYMYIEGPNTTKQSAERGVKALYLILIKNATIQNLHNFLKDKDKEEFIVVYPKNKKNTTKKMETSKTIIDKNVIRIKNNSNELSKLNQFYRKGDQNRYNLNYQSIQISFQQRQRERNDFLDNESEILRKKDKIQIYSSDKFSNAFRKFNEEIKKIEEIQISCHMYSSLIPHSIEYPQGIFYRPGDTPPDSMRQFRKSSQQQVKKDKVMYSPLPIKYAKISANGLPIISLSKINTNSISYMGSNILKTKRKQNYLHIPLNEAD